MNLQNASNFILFSKKKYVSLNEVLTQIFNSKLIHTMTMFSVICFTVSLFWCGDPDCLSSSSKENCASLVCSLLSRHENSNQNPVTGNVKDCSCVCHLPTISPNTATLLYCPILRQSIVELTFAKISSPSHSIFRPPIAS